MAEFDNSFIGYLTDVDIDLIDITKIKRYHSENPVNGQIINVAVEIIDIEKIKVFIPYNLPDASEYEAYVITDMGIVQVDKMYVITSEGLKEVDTIEVIGGEQPIPKEGRITSQLSSVAIDIINL